MVKDVNPEFFDNVMSNPFVCRTEWWLRVVKQTFINVGVRDKPKLDILAWHLIKLYGTTEGWELIPGNIN